METDSNGIYMKRPTPPNKRELGILRRLEQEEVKAVSLTKQIKEITAELKDVQQAVSSISNEIAVATGRASADRLDPYRY